MQTNSLGPRRTYNVNAPVLNIFNFFQWKTILGQARHIFESRLIWKKYTARPSFAFHRSLRKSFFAPKSH